MEEDREKIGHQQGATESKRGAPKILVLGASGTVGRLVVDELLQAGHPVRAISRDRSRLPIDVDAVTADIRHPEELTRALSGIEALFLATPDMERQVEVETGIIEAAARAGVCHITKLSAFRAEEEGSEIGRVHRTIEREIERSGCSWTFLRPSAFMQNFVTYYLQDMRAGLLRMPCGDAPVSFIDARDIAALAALSLSGRHHDGCAYAMYGPEALSYGQATEAVSRSMYFSARYEDISEDEYRVLSGNGAATERVIDLYRYYRTGAAAGPPIDLSSALGRSAYTLDQFSRFYGPAVSGPTQRS